MFIPMDFLIVYMLACEIMMLVTSAPVMACVDLKTFMEYQCNDPDKPNKCPASGKCYPFDEFCSSEGEVETCFPAHISANDTAILDWCRKPEYIQLRPACICACYSKFHKNYCSLICDHVTQPTVRNATSSAGQDYKPHDYQVTQQTVRDVTSSAAQDSKPCDYQGNSADGKWTIQVLVICLAASLIVNVVLVLLLLLLLFQRSKAPRRQNAATDDAELQDVNSQISRNNSKDSVNDETEEPAAPPVMIETLENDINRTRAALNLRNVSSNIQAESVEDSNTTNTQNGSPTNQFDSSQGTSTNTQNAAPLNQLDTSLGRSINIQNIDPVASSSSAHLRNDHGGTAAEMNPLILWNHAPESDDDIDQIQIHADLSIHSISDSGEVK